MSAESIIREVWHSHLRLKAKSNFILMFKTQSEYSDRILMVDFKKHKNIHIQIKIKEKNYGVDD